MNLINELRMLAEDLYVNGYSRYASAMSNAADELAKWEAVFGHLGDTPDECGNAIIAARDELEERLEAAEKERDALRAEIAEMEKQSPICRIKDIRRAHYMTKVVGLDPEAWLYTLPGAQNVLEKLCYDSRWEISIDYVDGWNAAIDAVRGKSPSWYCPDCCIVFPFGEPKSCPHDDARCNRALTAAPEVEGK